MNFPPPSAQSIFIKYSNSTSTLRNHAWKKSTQSSLLCKNKVHVLQMCLHMTIAAYMLLNRDRKFCELHKSVYTSFKLFDIGVILLFFLMDQVDLLPMHSIYSLAIETISLYFLVWQIGFNTKAIISIRSTSIRPDCKTLLFCDLFPLADVLEIFELMNTLDRAYFLPFARFRSTLFISLKTLIICTLLIWACYFC